MYTGALAGGGHSGPSLEVLGSCADPSPIISRLQRSVSDNTLVAMDFSGHAGRVIENPREALSAALEEAQAWRVRGQHPSACLSWVSMEWEEERGEGSCRKGF